MAETKNDPQSTQPQFAKCIFLGVIISVTALGITGASVGFSERGFGGLLWGLLIGAAAGLPFGLLVGFGTWSRVRWAHLNAVRQEQERTSRSRSCRNQGSLSH